MPSSQSTSAATMNGDLDLLAAYNMLPSPGSTGVITASDIVEMQLSMSRNRFRHMASNGPFVDVPADERGQFDEIFEELQMYESTIEEGLPRLASYIHCATPTPLIGMVTQLQQQREMLLGGDPPRFIMTLEQARQCVATCAMFHSSYSMFRKPEGLGVPAFLRTAVES